METIERLLQDLEIENPTRFSPEQLQTFTSNFSDSLGSGAFGDVYKGILQNGVQVAVKVLKGGILSEGIKDQFKAEVSVLCKTHHRNLVKLYGFCFEHNMKALVYEFMENESLDKLLYGSQTIEWEILFNIVTGTANGLSYLHKDCQPRIIHYDVKPSNILLDSKFSPKVGDFGLAKLLNQDKSYITRSKFRGTPNYAAPELIIPSSSITRKCDVYSYGITLFDIIGRRRHLLGEGQKWFPNHVWKKFEEQQHEELLKECSIHEKHREEAKRILLIALQCVQFRPEDRPSMSRVVRLLKGKEAVDQKLPNPFLYLGSSSKTNLESSTLTGSDRSYSAPTEPLLIGPWGGRGENNWDDGVNNGVKQILLFSGVKGISGIKIEYCGKDRESYWSSSHGNTDSNTVDIIKFDYPNEILTRVTGYYGSKENLSFTKVLFGPSSLYKSFLDETISLYFKMFCSPLTGYNDLEHDLSVIRATSFHLITHMRSLSFVTNKKTYGPFGYEEGTYFTSGKDGKVVGFHGRSSEVLDAIGLHMEYSNV